MIETEAPPRAAPDPPVRRRRRWLARTLGGLVIVVVLLFVAAALYAGHYDPLCNGECGIGGASGATTTHLGSFTAPTGESFDAYRVRWQPGGTFQFWFALSVDGRFPVTITNIGRWSPTDVWPGPYLRKTAVLVSNQQHIDMRSFRPFTLPTSGPDAVMDVHVTMVMRGCLPGGSAVTVSSMPVTFRAFGISHNVEVFLPETIEVESPPGTTCAPGS